MNKLIILINCETGISTLSKQHTELLSYLTLNDFSHMGQSDRINDLL